MVSKSDNTIEVLRKQHIGYFGYCLLFFFILLSNYTTRVA